MINFYWLFGVLRLIGCISAISRRHKTLLDVSCPLAMVTAAPIPLAARNTCANSGAFDPQTHTTSSFRIPSCRKYSAYLMTSCSSWPYVIVSPDLPLIYQQITYNVSTLIVLMKSTLQKLHFEEYEDENLQSSRFLDSRMIFDWILTIATLFDNFPKSFMINSATFAHGTDIEYWEVCRHLFWDLRETVHHLGVKRCRLSLSSVFIVYTHSTGVRGDKVMYW